MRLPSPIAALLLAATVLLSSLAFAQDRQGNDTPGEWVVTHQKAFGFWDSFCDERTKGNGSTEKEQRCYLRYVETYSPRPNFGAAFTFITPEGSGNAVEFSFERGLAFEVDGLRIDEDGKTLWSQDPTLCKGTRCFYQSTEADQLLDIMQNAQKGALVFEFTGRDGTDWKLEWELEPFKAALADFNAQTARRNLR